MVSACFSRVSALALALLFAAPLAVPALAQEDESVSSTTPSEDTSDVRIGNAPSYSGGNNRTDQDDARDEQRRGALIKYSLILKSLKKDVPGDVLKVRLLKRNPMFWTYEFVVLDETGHLTQVSLNARTGKIISKKKR